MLAGFLYELAMDMFCIALGASLYSLSIQPEAPYNLYTSLIKKVNPTELSLLHIFMNNQQENRLESFNLIIFMDWIHKHTLYITLLFKIYLCKYILTQRT